MHLASENGLLSICKWLHEEAGAAGDITATNNYGSKIYSKP
jgi:hypothetical protein